MMPFLTDPSSNALVTLYATVTIFRIVYALCKILKIKANQNMKPKSSFTWSDSNPLSSYLPQKCSLPKYVFPILTISVSKSWVNGYLLNKRSPS